MTMALSAFCRGKSIFIYRGPGFSFNFQDSADPRLFILGLAGQHSDVIRWLDLAAAMRVTAENQELRGWIVPHGNPHHVAHNLAGEMGKIIVT